jgi:hypothetical protein
MPVVRKTVNAGTTITIGDTSSGTFTLGGSTIASWPTTSETVVTGAVVRVSAGNRYFFTTPSNVVLSASLTAGQVVNYVAIRNTTNAPITAVAETSAWVWTGGSMTNTIPTNSMMTFGFACNPITGKTNAYATAASVN